MTKILLIVLIVLIIKSLIENFIPSNFLRKKNKKGDSTDDIIDVDYEEVD